MNFDPKTYIALAEHLNNNINNLPIEIGEESASRTELNRYYYGISTQTHFFLINSVNDAVYQAESKKTHKFLRDQLIALNQREAQLLAIDLAKLFKMRWEADYKYPVSINILRMMIRDQKHLVTRAQLKLDILMNAFPPLSDA